MVGYPHHTESCPEFNVNLHASALSYVDLNWRIIPVVGKVPPKGTTWKDPLPWDEIEPVILRPDTTGIAVILGEPPSNLIVRDFDVPNSYDQWRDANPDLASHLPTSFTPGNQGYHVFARTEKSYPTARLGDGEFRATGAYVVIPPSRHLNGGVYQWIVQPFEGIPILSPFDLESKLARHPKYTHAGDNLDNLDLDPEDWYTHAGSIPYYLDQDWYTHAKSCEETTPTPHMACVYRDKQTLIEDAIACTIPIAFGNRNRRIFDLARRLKTIVGYDIDVDTLRSYVVQWHRQSLPNIKTKDFAETWKDFVHAWEGIKTPIGIGLAKIRQIADSDKFTRDCCDPNGDRVARVFRAASLVHRGREFYMPYRTLADCSGLSPRSARYIALRLVGEGLVTIVERGVSWEEGKRSGIATVWRWTGGR